MRVKLPWAIESARQISLIVSSLSLFAFWFKYRSLIATSANGEEILTEHLFFCCDVPCSRFFSIQKFSSDTTRTSSQFNSYDSLPPFSPIALILYATTASQSRLSLTFKTTEGNRTRLDSVFLKVRNLICLIAGLQGREISSVLLKSRGHIGC